MTERPTFSPFWHRVRAMKPRLRPHVQITRQFYRGQRWHVVHDPATNQFYRLNPIAHEFVGLFDSRRTVEEIWQHTLTRHGDQAPTQNEVIQLLSQLHHANLLHAETTPETEQLLARGRERTQKKVKQQAIGLMYFKMRVFNPDRILSWLSPIMKPLLNRWGLLAWAILITWAIVANIIPNWDRLVGGFDKITEPANWGWLILVFVITKLIHETGHGVICKRLGGQVPEFGFMMLVLFPAPYVDASACWAFPSKWQRMAVGAGGMIFELATAAAASFLWISAPEGSIASRVAYSCMLTASVSTVIFNANPLMRFDGYYMLSDLLEIPNLMQRSMNMLKFYCQKHIYRIEQAIPPTNASGEKIVLTVYGVLAMAYRLFLFFSITLAIMGKLFAVGFLLAIWTAVMWFVLPVGGFIHWLATNPHLSDFRGRAVLTSLGLIAAGVILIGLVPAPDHRRAVGVVESAARTGVFIGADGFVISSSARPGDRVKQGDPIVTLESAELVAQYKLAQAQLGEAQAQERRASGQNEAAAQIARERIQTYLEQIAHYQTKIERLTVRAPHDGVVVGNDPATLVGAFLKEGSPVCEIVDLDNLRVTATLSQTEASWLFQLSRDQYDVKMRLVSDVDTVRPGGPVRVIDAGQKDLPHAALGFAGGGTIETDPQDKSGRHSKRHQFKVYIEPAEGEARAWPGAPGERVTLRFHLPRRPLMEQWVDRLQKLIQGRVNI
ncbi:MAG: PqqD family peptide modification chaperone [Phycisphaerales bacterium]|nr:PqqD family peptide modification chaperone [Phycisphaerales bacterium]